MHAMIHTIIRNVGKLEWDFLLTLARIYFVKNLNGSRFVLILETTRLP